MLIPNSLRILDRLGVLSSIKQGAFTHTQFSIVKKDGSLIGRMIMGSEERYGYPAIRVYRDQLRRALPDAAEKSGVDIKYGMRCTGIESRPFPKLLLPLRTGKR